MAILPGKSPIEDEKIEKTRVAGVTKPNRQYITPRKQVVNHGMLKAYAMNEDYQIESELARGAESVLYVGKVHDQKVCIKSVRGLLNKMIGDSVTRRQEEKLEKVPYKTKVRHITNEFEVSKIVCGDDPDMPLVHIYALRKVKKYGLEMGYDLIMEYMQGHDLGEKTVAKSLSVEDKIDVFVQALQALSYFHSKKLIHLDIKPSNFFLSQGKVKLFDFGVSVATGYKPTAITGTGGYLSPEQICKEQLNTATDMFAMGVAFATFFGAKPLNQPQSSLVMKQFRQDAKYHLERETTPSIIDIPELEDYPDFAAIIRDCTIAKRELRIGSCLAALERIKTWAKDNNVTIPSLKA